uniref:Peptidase M12A domain-containing protein n=1 Tax=Acrobeloides nanus TaxID=290746 RepID=A0A914EAM5_9BILA
MSRINLVLLIVIFYLSWEAYVLAQTNNELNIPSILQDTVKKVKKNFAKLSDVAKNKLLKICAKKNCKEEPAEVKSRRNDILKAEYEFQKKFNPSLTLGEVESKFNAMHRAKKKFLEVAGLGSSVTPHDDGTFGHDNLLTETQSNSLISDLTELVNEVEETLEEVTGTATGTLGQVTSGLTGLLGKKKRNSLFFEENYAARWDPNVPIPYTFDANVALNEQGMVHNALQQISSVSCLRFQYVPQQPNTNHLYYTKFSTAG